MNPEELNTQSRFVQLSIFPEVKLWEQYLILVYVFLIPFVRIYTLPHLGAKIQPAEVLFVFLIPLLIRWAPFIWREFPGWGQFLLGGYLVVNLVSGAIAGELNGILESIGRVYLVCLFLLGWVLAVSGGQSVVDKVVKIWFGGTLAMAGVALVGYFSGMAGWLNETVSLYEDYPYLGTVLRASGFTGGPGMLCIVLIPGLLYAFGNWDRQLYRFLFWVLLSVLVLTFSKEILLAGVALLWVSNRKLKNLPKFAFTTVIVLVYVFGTHYVVARQGGVNDMIGSTHFSSNRSVFESGQYRVVETSYVTLKRASVLVGSSHPFLGVGPGNFQNEVAAMQLVGLFPRHLPAYEPHSTWFGGFAEMGVLGLMALVLLSLWIFFFLYQSRGDLFSYPESRLLLVYILIILVISISMDVLNFRHLWLPLGLLMGYVYKDSDNVEQRTVETTIV